MAGFGGTGPILSLLNGIAQGQIAQREEAERLRQAALQEQLRHVQMQSMRHGMGLADRRENRADANFERQTSQFDRTFNQRGSQFDRSHELSRDRLDHQIGTDGRRLDQADRGLDQADTRISDAAAQRRIDNENQAILRENTLRNSKTSRAASEALTTSREMEAELESATAQVQASPAALEMVMDQSFFGREQELSDGLRYTYGILATPEVIARMRAHFQSLLTRSTPSETDKALEAAMGSVSIER